MPVTAKSDNRLFSALKSPQILKLTLLKITKKGDSQNLLPLFEYLVNIVVLTETKDIWDMLKNTASCVLITTD